MEHNYKEQIGLRLKYFAQENFPSIDAFSRAVGVHPSAMRSIYFKGRSSPGAEMLLKLIRLGCSVQWLLRGLESKNKLKAVTMEKIEKEQIGERLRKFAESNFNSLAEFGRELGKDRTFFTPYFNGSSTPGGELLIKLMDLGCDIRWLLKGVETKNIQEENKTNRKIKIDIKPIDLQYKIKKMGLNQRFLARQFNVTDSAVSLAVNNNLMLKKLRIKIINYLNKNIN